MMVSKGEPLGLQHGNRRYRGSDGSPPEAEGPSGGGSASASAAESRYADPIQTFIVTVQAVILQPVEFFRGTLRQGDFITPLSSRSSAMSWPRS
jgi:hypothetical protein